MIVGLARTGFAAVIGMLVAVPVSHAATVTYDGGTVVFAAEAGETLNVNVGYETVDGQPHVSFYQADEYTYPTSACQVDWEGALLCRLGDGVRVLGGSGDDGISAHDPDLGGFQPGAPYKLAFSGGPGDDRLDGAALSDTLDGGEGFDDLDGGEANDVLLGGAGNDTLKGGDGADELRGGDGNDTLTGDEHASHRNTVSADVIDGGPGLDKIEEDWYRFDDSANYLDPPPTVTLDGQANDGRPGENDNVLSIEEIYSSPGGTFTGSDAAEKFVMFSAASVSAGGGNDEISGSVDPDTLDGGPGDDTIVGHSGDDVIVGGSGRDTINGDRAASCFYGPIFGACSIPAGNDTIHAVDGEEDSIECDIGTDVAEVDAIDRVSGCEDVRLAKSNTPDDPGANGDEGTTGTQTCRVPKLKGLRLKAAKKRLARRNCRVGRIKPGPRRRRAGMVVRRQRPKPGTVRKQGSRVRIILGKRRR